MSWALAIVVVAAACSDPNGTVLVIEGDKEFDQIEVYFGTPVGDRTPTTEHRLTNPAGELQLLEKRHKAEDDVPPARATAEKSWGYLIPTTEKNLELGNYVLVIALKGGVPIGVAERFDFMLPVEDAVYRYPMKLVDIANQDVERWGSPIADCARWTYPRGDGKPTTVAVVRANDSDCDTFPDPGDADMAGADSAPLAYCDPRSPNGCPGVTSCLTTAMGRCASGTCMNREGATSACEPTTCLDPRLCEWCEADEGNPEQLVACSLRDTTTTHDDVYVPVGAGMVLCSNPYVFHLALPIPCAAPLIEFGTNWLMGATFGFAIAGDGNTCKITITQPPSGPAPFTPVPHLLISVANGAGAMLARTQFVVGLDSELGCGITLPHELNIDLDTCR